MTRTYWMAASILGLAAMISLGLWVSGFPPEWDLDKGESVSGVRMFLTAPMRIVAVGTVLTIIVALSKRQFSNEGKAGRLSVTAVLFTPILTLFLQVAMPLMIYDVIGENDADVALGLLVAGFFLIMGNYIVTAPFGGKVGFRNQWTLSDPRIWARTHRFLGRSLVLGTLMLIPVFLLLKPSFAIYAPLFLALPLKGVSWLYSRSLSQRLGLRSA